jgi:uncharacterized protein YjbI with pentapeptide repeats
MIGVFTIATTLQQSQLSQQQYSHTQTLADDQQKEDVLVNYQKETSDLLLNYKLGSSKEGDPVTVVARAKTLTALRRLDPDRKATLLQFLYEARLVGSVQLRDFSLASFQSRSAAIVFLGGADLRQVHLDTWANLSGIDLSQTDLSGANLSGVALYYASLSAQLSGADLSDASLYGADLSGAGLSGAKLSGADLYYADLRGAYATGSDLHRAELYHADLRNANLNGANLYQADLKGANLNGADLRNADLKGATVTKKQLARAQYLKGAILPDGSIYPSQSYPIPNHVEPPPPGSKK